MPIALYARQNMIEDLSIPQVASVVGCGGTGFWTAVFLAMSGVEELILVDSDIVEVSNLNRLLFDDKCVGKKKTDALAELICRIRKEVRIETHNSRIEKPIDCQMLRGSIFCCTDSLKSQQLVCAYCKKNELPYQRIGYDGTILNVSKTFPITFEKVEEQHGYTITPSWVVPAALAAATGVASQLYKELCLMDDIGQLHIQTSSHICPKILDKARKEGEKYILDDIDEHIPDSYGYCEDCDRINPDDSNYGYCPDCEEHYSDAAINEIKEETKEEEFNDIVGQIEADAITNPGLEEAIRKLIEKRRLENVKRK